MTTNMHQMNNDKSLLGDPTEIGYTKTTNTALSEPPMVDPESEECYAKIVRTERDTGIYLKYFVKAKIDRSILDPWDDNDIRTNIRHAKAVGRDPYKFIEISKAGFDCYMYYLITKAKAHFDRARREIRRV